MSLYIRVLVGLVAFTVLGVDDKSSKMPLLLAYSPVAQPRAGRANQNPPKGGRVGARKSGTAAVYWKCSICLGPYIERAWTKCNHSFCRKCITEVCRTNPPTNRAPCPFCRRPVLLGELTRRPGGI